MAACWRGSKRNWHTQTGRSLSSCRDGQQLLVGHRRTTCRPPRPHLNVRVPSYGRRKQRHQRIPARRWRNLTHNEVSSSPLSIRRLGARTRRGVRAAITEAVGGRSLRWWRCYIACAPFVLSFSFVWRKGATFRLKKRNRWGRVYTRKRRPGRNRESIRRHSRPPELPPNNIHEKINVHRLRLSCVAPHS